MKNQKKTTVSSLTDIEHDQTAIEPLINKSLHVSELFDSDLLSNDKENMIQHETLYTDLLRVYVASTRDILAKKQRLKEDFYRVCMFILTFTCAVFFIVIFLMLTGIIPPDHVSVLIGVFVSFLTVFIIIPHTIAAYLFNNEEEKYMADIIKSIQEHDVEIRKGIK